MTRVRTLVGGLLVAGSLVSVPTLSSYVIDNYWRDSDDVVMDNVFSGSWATHAENQLAEWNEIDVTTNDHPFLMNPDPQWSFGAHDGDNTMGFLAEASVISEYGHDYTGALAWTFCWHSLVTGRLDECDVVLDPTLPWRIVSDDEYYFQSTIIHEAGHIRGLDHYNAGLSVENSAVNKKLRGETLYMDDRNAIRQHATHVAETDVALYNKWHDGAVPHWMTMTPPAAPIRVGQAIDFDGVTVENRGDQALGSSMRVGFYMSPNETISTADTLVDTATWAAFAYGGTTTLSGGFTIPAVPDCGTRYFGAIVDDNHRWAERYEGNNAAVFADGTPAAQPYTINLERDSLEPNDSFAGARTITLPMTTANLSIDQDSESDYYRFSLTWPSRVDVRVTFTHSAGNIDLQLLDSAGAVIASSTGLGDSEDVSEELGAGTYRIRVFGVGGGSCNHYSISASATPPSIYVNATDSTATETGPTTGTLRITRVGSTEAPLTAFYSVGGTATSGVDYTSIGRYATIPAGESSVPITVTPILDSAVEVETVILTLSSHVAYTIGAPDSATITITDGPDLVVSALSAPATSGTGATITVGVTTKNQGNSAAGGSMTRVYLSLNNSTLEPEDTLLMTALPGTLAASGTHASSAPIVVPATTPDGSHYLIAVSDAGGAVTETKETNNTRTKSLKIGPDLSISSLKIPVTSVPAGGTLKLTEKTKNALGSSPAAPSTTRVYLSLDAVLDKTDILLASRAVPALTSGAISSNVHTLTMPAGATGARYLIAVADAEFVVWETNENNNRKTKAFTITP